MMNDEPLSFPCPHCGEPIVMSMWLRGDRSRTEKAIEFYYRARAAQGKRPLRKITLRQIAEKMGLNYGYLRQRKMEYDATGGWGSKARQ